VAGTTKPSKNGIFGYAFSYGAEPTGKEGPEDSLNVGLVEVAPHTGTDPLPEDAYADSTNPEMYCEGATDVGTFGSSGACWAPYQPGFEVNAEM
jgi:hypothetical protein